MNSETPSVQSGARDARVTVALLDTTTPDALVRCAQQVRRTGREAHLVILTARAVALPVPLARTVRLVRVARPDQLEAAAGTEASSADLVVVAPTSAAFSKGWIHAVRERASEHSQVISVVGDYGRSILVVPPAVRSVTGVRVGWLEAPGLRLRESAASHVSRQSLSAVMIVKDEEELLDECLAALAPFVDEIVVYDTGSTDATMDIARRHGVVLVEGYWNDHFGDARNRALEHATGDWVMQIDADEVLTGDAAALRRQLDTEAFDQISLTILSTAFRGATTGVESQPVRFFRRGLYRWVNALHEHPAPLPGVRVAGMSPLRAPVKILHSGYEAERTEARDKINRNLALSTRELQASTASSTDRASLLSNQGRTLAWAGKSAEAMAVFEELRTTPGMSTAIILGGRAAIELILAGQQSESFEPWLEELAAQGDSAGNLAAFRARKHLMDRDPEAALEAMSAVPRGQGGTDVWGFAFDEARRDVIEAVVEVLRGDSAKASDLVITAMQRSPEAVPVQLLLQMMAAAERPLEEALAAAPPAFLERAVREVSGMHPLHALAWYEADYAAHRTEVRPVVAGNLFAARAGWRVAMVWTLRAMELGLADVNALRTLAEDDAAPKAERCIAAALLAEYFGDAAMGDRFEQLSTLLTTAQETEVITALVEAGIKTSSVDITATSISSGAEPVGAQA